MLGSDLLPRLESSGATVVGVDRDEVDLRSAAEVGALLSEVQPDVVVNCAAWTAVDDAETHEAQALAINGGAPENLVAACESLGAHGQRDGAGPVLLQVSTDYVFAGDATEPYAEDAPTGPLTAYGRTKLVGEQAVLAGLPTTGYVVRTAWLYGAHGPNFVATMLKLERERDTLTVVDDQHGQPTWTVDLADRLALLGEAALAGAAPSGVYHATSAGRTTWYGFARAVFELAGADPSRVQPVPTSAFPRPAPRPAWSVLGHDRWQGTGIAPIGDWRERLAAAFPVLRG
jgi:dTDP-4-dehydrorhamnose reductase